MTSEKNPAAEGIKGAVEEAKGRIKQAVGALTGNDDLAAEGGAQEDKGEATQNAAKREAEAESARHAADVSHAREQMHQEDRQ
ncbi:CsbD family protein [Gordonia amarae]|uniref:Uncharacterized protein n=2 Tax=Gordonia amarae TaxID=36821 RepID=G7GUI9_9ACTN|nr:CsbD family protein [Gordonia amarae]MCS3877390.1 uncharacterized protein YjbJ (UPF0337 family) [Gordonia amarae]QHN16138.1 CsbD family protein [Gordonia amarae]QHN20706.1 CsbD family protein [Gordonia amarae]QHN29558.1 CsbD family protein [Gordonia amarae]QHN38334.1 CsbD family protein [Gordonia amarae]